MPEDAKIMKWGVITAAVIIVVRIILEQLGSPDTINNIFGVAWMYLILPVLFALGIRSRNSATPFRNLLKDVVLFAFYSRIMVMLTYMLAYVFRWPARRFVYPGGNVGENVDVWTGIFIIPLRNVLIWVVMATIIGMIIGSITFLIKRKASVPSPVL